MIVKSGSRERIGNKAFDLYRCGLLGVNVPKFYIIPSKYCSMTAELKSELDKILKKLGGCVAVRSSSISEDTANVSSAGRFKTVLNVKNLAELINAVKEVWRSAKGSDMAVIIQQQLEPELAGVLLTRNPTNSREEIVIEYVSGLGDKLVLGKKDPVRLTFGQQTHSKKFKKLIEISQMLEQNFGYPLDIEWALCGRTFYILQARPITNLPPPEKNNARTYSRVQAEQFYSGPVSPLFYSYFKLLHSKYYIQETFDDIGLDLNIKNSLVRHKSYLYVDTSLAEYALTHLPSKGSRELLKDVFPDDMKEDLLNKSGRVDPIVIFKLLKFVIRNPRIWIWKLDKHFSDEVVPQIYANLNKMKDFQKMDLEELDQAYNEIMDTAVLHIRTSKWGLALYLPPLIGAVNKFIEKNMIDKNCLSTLMSGLPVNKTLDASMELKQLAKIIRENPQAREAVERDVKDYTTFKHLICNVPKGELIIDYFESILKRFGHRRLSRDLLAPSWNDEPEIPLSILRKLVCDKNPDLSDTKQLSIERRISMESKIKSYLSYRKRRRFELLTKYFVRYLTFREYQRFYLDMIISKMRQLVLEVGRRMVKDKLITRPDDVFFIELSDLKDYLTGIKNQKLQKLAEFQRITFENEKGTPGLFLRGNVDFNSAGSLKGERILFHNKKVILGQAVSPGFFSGKVRVVPDIDKHIELDRNDIVVTKCIDPGQTHVFLMAGALIFETGGMLSHGAILAREFNLPTVANIKNATSIFKNNQRIAVNGTKGEVILEGI